MRPTRPQQRHKRNSKKFGWYMAKGLAYGMDSNIGIVRTAGLGMARAAAQATKEGVKVSSPSKVYAQIGKELGRGLVKGINDSTEDIENAAKDQTGALIAATTEGLDLSSLPPNFFGYGETSAEQFVAGFRTAIAAAKGVMSAVVSDAVPKAAFVNQQTARPNLSDIVGLAGTGGVKTVVVKAELRGQPVLDFVIDGLNGRAKVTGASLVEV